MMCKGWMNPLIPESTRIKIADDEITRLRAELAKVTWQRNEAQADLAASRVECERLRTGDTCARQCEGTAYRIEAQKFKRALGYIAAMPHARDAYIVAIQALDRPIDAALAGEVKP